MRIDDLGDILTSEELLAILPIGRNSLYALLKNGELKSIKCGGKYIITKMELLRYLEIDNKNR